MFTFILRFLGNVLVGICLASLSLLFMSIASLLRLTPRFLRFIRLCLRGFLVLSVRLYAFLFSILDPIIQQLLHADILADPCRMVACLLSSLLIGLLLVLLSISPVSPWIILPCLVHGVAVDLAWGEFEQPGGVQMGRSQ